MAEIVLNANRHIAAIAIIVAAAIIGCLLYEYTDVASVILGMSPRCGRSIYDDPVGNGFMHPVRGGDTGQHYDDGGAFSEGLANVRVGTKWGYIDSGGNIAVPIEYDMARPFTDGKGLVESGGKLLFIDAYGRCLYELPDTVECATAFYRGYARICDRKGKWGLINASGDVVIQPAYDGLSDPEDGVLNAETHGFIYRMFGGMSVHFPITGDEIRCISLEG